jgi:arylsulfatase A-like enzyme
MRRRDFFAAVPAAIPASGTKRNVLLLYAEQFQHDVATFAGGPAKTPNLDRFAAGATVFRTACTTTALCSPARAALFTGRLGHRTGLDDNCYIWHSRLNELAPKQTTLIEWAGRRGYLMGYYGKWHLGEDRRKIRPEAEFQKCAQVLPAGGQFP